MTTPLGDLADDLLGGPWKKKMKGLLSPLGMETPVLQWDELSMVVGVVRDLENDVIRSALLPFVPHKGFDQNGPSVPYELIIPDWKASPITFKPGSCITCLGSAVHKPDENRLIFAGKTQILYRPDFSTDFGWDATHLFCGAFEGWSQAFHFLPRTALGVAIGREVFVDLDEDVMMTWSEKHRTPYSRLPIDKVKIWNAAGKQGLLGDVADRSILNAIFSQVNALVTASPPCVSWSKGGKQKGLECEPGWSFIEAVKMSFFMQACILTLECSDEFPRHPQAKLVFGVLSLLGFRRIWDQVVTYHQLADCFRTRWISAWSRSDVPFIPFDTTFTLKDFPRQAWSGPEYDFRLPLTMREQLQLSPSEIAMYADKELLPEGKKKGLQMTPEDVLQARIVDPLAPLPTLCASYSTQHLIECEHLGKKGIFAVLQKENNRFYFIDPVRWISLLGSIDVMCFPSKIGIAFKMIGNAIAVPHALLALLIAFQSAHKRPIPINQTILECWNARLLASNAVLLAGSDFWTIVRMQDYINSIHALVPDFHPECTTISVTFEFRRHNKNVQMNLPSQWSIRRVAKCVLGIDHHACHTITCGNLDRRANSYTTLGDMASFNREWDLMLKSVEFARLTFTDTHAAPRPSKRPFEATQQAAEANIVLDIPTFDQILEQPKFQAFLKIMEEFYTTTQVRTPDDAKLMVHIGIPHPGFVTRIPIRKGQQHQQIRQIAHALFPDNPPRALHIPPVPLTTVPQYPIYMLLPPQHHTNKVSVIIEEYRNKTNIFTADVPTHINSKATLHFHHRTWTIYLHNSAEIRTDDTLIIQNADIITVTPTTSIKKSTDTSNVIAAGHHTQQSPSILTSPARLEERIEFAINTLGWLASDEMCHCIELLLRLQPNFGTFVGIGTWDLTTNEITPMHSTEVIFHEHHNNLFPVLAGAHWIGAMIQFCGTTPTITLIGTHDIDHMTTRDAFAGLLEAAPANIALTEDQTEPITHMCGWQLLQTWFHESQALTRATNPTARFDTIHPEVRQAILEMIDESVTEWTQANASTELIDLAHWLRLAFFIHIAQGATLDTRVTTHSLFTNASTRAPQPPINQAAADANILIQHRLQLHSNHPTWMATDELDFLLEPVRHAKPAIHFAHPVAWHAHTQSFHVYNHYHIDLRPYAHAFIFVLSDNHWHLLEILKVSTHILLFTTFDTPQAELYRHIAQLAGVHPHNIEVQHWTHNVPNGLCGWDLILQIYIRFQVQTPETDPTQLLALNLTTEAQLVNSIRSTMRAHFSHMTTHQECCDFAQKARVLHLLRVLAGNFPMQYNHGGAKDIENPDGKHKNTTQHTQKAQQAVVDPLFVNDPWASARKQARPPQTRWEDLTLPNDHPFQNTANKLPLEQLHRLQHTTNRVGIIMSTKQHLADITKVPTPGPLAVVLPSADKAAFGDAAIYVKGPYEVVVNDNAMKTSYKRLVMLFVVKGDVDFVLPTPTIKCNAADFVEVVAEIDSRLLGAGEFQQVREDPMTTFKKLLAGIHKDLNEHATFYALRKFNTGPASQDVHIQIVCRVPRSARTKMLEASGEHALLVRDYVDDVAKIQDTSVLPKFTSPTASNLHDLRITTRGIPGAAGIVLARRGLALRMGKPNCRSKGGLHVRRCTSDKRQHEYHSQAFLRIIGMANEYRSQQCDCRCQRGHRFRTSPNPSISNCWSIHLDSFLPRQANKGEVYGWCWRFAAWNPPCARPSTLQPKSCPEQSEQSQEDQSSAAASADNCLRASTWTPPAETRHSKAWPPWGESWPAWTSARSFWEAFWRSFWRSRSSTSPTVATYGANPYTWAHRRLTPHQASKACSLKFTGSVLESVSTSLQPFLDCLLDFLWISQFLFAHVLDLGQIANSAQGTAQCGFLLEFSWTSMLARWVRLSVAVPKHTQCDMRLVQSWTSCLGPTTRVTAIAQWRHLCWSFVSLCCFGPFFYFLLLLLRENHVWWCAGKIQNPHQVALQTQFEPHTLFEKLESCTMSLHGEQHVDLPHIAFLWFRELLWECSCIARFRNAWSHLSI